MEIRFALLLAACHLPLTLAAQVTPADTGTLVLVISRSHDAPARDMMRIAGARVALASGAVVGTSSDSGYVVLHDLAPGRIQVTMRAKDYLPLTCRLNVRLDRSDTVHAEMGPERSGGYWAFAGCKQRR